MSSELIKTPIQSTSQVLTSASDIHDKNAANLIINEDLLEPLEENHNLNENKIGEASFSFQENKQNDEDNLVENFDENNFENNGEEVHIVSFVVTVTAAFPADVEKEIVNETSNKPRATEGPKPQVIKFFTIFVYYLFFLIYYFIFF